MLRCSLLTAVDLLWRSGLIDRIVKALGNRKVEQFGGIEPNPSLETCERAVAFIKEHGVDFVLAVGGGSVVDATKLYRYGRYL